MAYQPLEELLPKSGYSIYKLVRMASNRATELAEGKRPMVETTPNTKTATIALEEIRNAKVVLKDVAENFKPVDKPAQKVAAKEPELSAS